MDCVEEEIHRSQDAASQPADSVYHSQQETAVNGESWWRHRRLKPALSPSPFISFKNAIIQAIAMTHEQDN